MTNMPSDMLTEGNAITVDIVDRAGDRVGPGPIMSCLSFNCDTRISEAGRFDARFPANDPMLQYLQLKKHFLDFYIDDQLIFYGLAESWNREIDDDGQQFLVVSGRDSLGELAETTIDFTAIEEDAEPVFNAPQLVINAYNTLGSGESWSLANGITDTGVYGDFAGESALTALSKIAAHIGEAYRIVGRRDIEWLGITAGDSGVWAVQGAGDPIQAEGNRRICFIQSLSERRDASRMLTKIYPYGAGLGETRLDLTGITYTVPAGFTYDAGENSISSDDALAYVGKTIGRHVNFKDIRPLFNTDADILSAKNFLAATAVFYLRRNDGTDDTVEYDLEVAQLPPEVKVGMSLRVTYQDDVYDLEEDLIILGIRHSISGNGVVTYSLTVANTNQWRLRETNTLVAQMEVGELFAGHPQIDANTYWMIFREEIGDDQIDHIAEMPFVLSEEVQTIRQVLFRYKVDRLLAASIEYADPNTGLGGTSTTSATAPGSTDNDGSGTSGATAAGTTVSGGSGTSGGTAAGSTISGGNGISGGAAAGNTNNDGTGTTSDTTITVSASGSTTIGTTLAPTIATRTDSLGTSGQTTFTAGALSANPATHSHEITAHQHVYSHTHFVTAEHGHTVSPSTHNHSTPNHIHLISATHTHTTPDHAHSITATHTHTTPAHTHSITATHTHTTPVHVHVISATHTHTIAQHTHAAPTLVYKLRRWPALESYVMADLEYSVNGGAWVSLDTGIPVAGGYYQADVTSDIQNPDGLRRPFQPDNLIQVRRKTAAGTGKTALIRAQIGVRCTIQSIVIYS